MEFEIWQLIMGGAAVVFGPPGAMGAVMKYQLNGHLDKISETNVTVKEIKIDLDEAKDERHALDNRVTILETKQEVASSP